MITLSDDTQSMRLQDFNMRPLRNYSKPLSGAITYNTQHIPGQIGDWVFNSEVGPKTYSLESTILEADFEKLEEQLERLNTFLFDGKGQPKLLKCQWDNSKKFAYVRLASPIIPDVSSVLERVPIQFINHDGGEYAESDAYDPTPPLLYDTGLEYGIKAYPNEDSFQWIYQQHYFGVENWSGLDTDLKITINGTYTNGKITHLQTGTVFNLPNLLNGTIVIDGNNFNVSVNGVDVLEFDGDFFQLVGGDNGFLFETDTVKANVSFEWYHKYN